MIRIKSVFIYTTLFSFLMLFLLLYILGAARYVTDFEENTCDMTYMFEYPQYVRISLDDKLEEQYQRYGLYAYGEGFITEKLRRMYFTGIPVLFVPGNAGSHQQVRSLASVSLRKSLKDRTPFHFDYFTVSFGKEYSALYGGVLMEETLYVSHCIKKILSLYKTNVEKIVLIGHSMHTAGKRLYIYEDMIQFKPGGEWIEDIRKQYTWTNKNLSKKTSSIYLMIRLRDEPDHLTIDTINLESKDWLFVCTASIIEGQSRVCNWGWNLTNKTRISVDPLHRLRKTVDLNFQEIKYPGVTHIIVRITPEDLDNFVAVNVDLYSYDTRVIPIKSELSILNKLLVKRRMTKTDSGHIRYYATFNDISAIAVELKASECTDPKHHAIVELLEPWSVGVTQIQFFTVIDDGPKTLKIQTRHDTSNVSANLRITLDPACLYTINIQESGIIDKISCIVRDRWYLLYTTIISLLLIFLSIKTNHDNEQIPIVLITIFFSFYYNLIFESLVSMAIICVFIIGLCCSVIFLGSVAHSIAVRFLARAIAFSTTWSDWLLGGLNQLPFITTILVLSLVPATCGALAMIISVFLYFLNLTKMYEDYLEELLMASLQHFNWIRPFRNAKNNPEEQENTRQKIFNHLIFFILWCFVAIPAVPSVLVWAKNFSYDMRLSTEDPLLLKSWVILVACSTLGWVQIPSNDGIRSKILSRILYFVGWIVLSMGAAYHPAFYQYYMPPIVAGIIAMVALNFVTS
ncbi:GPI inositol-deacylase isoform X2 [Megachile rotundata]|uniref:GPI inositol-deacylase isoform X2 n=1 Tax=Megachile rotundata TaxID=143995 RepID=UPI003FD06846